LEHLAGALKNAYPDELLEILVAEKNIGNSTYDGIELGAERVTKEIEDHIAKLKEDGKRVEKLSISGYSLGGVVARYVIGLLYTRGIFDTVQPMVSHHKSCVEHTSYSCW
jgi:esterase/lipase